ncbi:epstein-Barr nuclear antigen 3 [Striga asiatica]|uniref:Epstein-Barr nuclear antigen 3 n=1 Tax=Striga asiatica TaxID=4170 RepID=A0A5A7Q9V4_STRAF|nr:epstein-Barr nuclear antigen 3 [Striga asiatica]
MEMVEIGRGRRFRKRSSDNERKKANLLNFYFLFVLGFQKVWVEVVEPEQRRRGNQREGFLSECKLKWFKYFKNFCVVFLVVQSSTESYLSHVIWHLGEQDIVVDT